MNDMNDMNDGCGITKGVKLFVSGPSRGHSEFPFKLEMFCIRNV